MVPNTISLHKVMKENRKEDLGFTIGAGKNEEEKEKEVEEEYRKVVLHTKHRHLKTVKYRQKTEDAVKNKYRWTFIQIPDAIMSDMRCKAAQAA